MPSNDVMNDSSFIDEGTFQDRDWSWSFSALWNKKSAERCRVNIADTVFVSGGEPASWMFTAKVRALFRDNRPLPLVDNSGCTQPLLRACDPEGADAGAR